MRKPIHEVIITRQLLMIHDFKTRIKLLTYTESLGNEETYDDTEQGSNTLKAIEINSLHKALESTMQEPELLKN